MANDYTLNEEQAEQLAKSLENKEKVTRFTTSFKNESKVNTEAISREIRSKVSYNPQNLKIAALSTGIHIFEGHGEFLHDVTATHVTKDAFTAVASYLLMINQEAMQVTVCGKKYELTISETEESE